MLCNIYRRPQFGYRYMKHILPISGSHLHVNIMTQFNVHIISLGYNCTRCFISYLVQTHWSPPLPNSRRGARDIRSYAKEPPGTAQVKSIRREHTNRPQPRWLTMIVRGWWERVRGPLHNHEGGILSGDEGREGGHPLNLLNPTLVTLGTIQPPVHTQNRKSDKS